MAHAQSFFLIFCGETLLEETKIGAILKKTGAAGRIYVAGLLVAEEENFAFSYNITSLTEAMKKALNRERTNVGRTAYAERVKAMLLQTRSSEVATILADQLRLLERGTAADEVGWKDVTVHACKILNASGRFLFVTSYQLLTNTDAIDHARGDGLQVVTVPETILEAIRGGEDLAGAPIRDLGVYQAEWNDSFTFDWVALAQMTPAEHAVFIQKDRIAALVGGLPKHVRDVRVSQTMRVDFSAGGDALGLWDPASASIVIRRDQLQTLADFAGTLLHEIAHARSGYGDVTRAFEGELTDYLGLTAAAALPAAASPRSKRGFWPR